MLSQGVAEHAAHNVRRFRTHRGWSLSELARRARIDPGTVKHVEAGGNATLRTLLALADALGISLNVLLFDGYERSRHAVEVIRAGDGSLVELGGMLVRHLAEIEAPNRVTLQYVQLKRGKPWTSEGHEPGSVERLFLIEGRAEAGPTEQPVTAEPGDFVTFWADLPHGYRALDRTAIGILLWCRETVARTSSVATRT